VQVRHYPKRYPASGLARRRGLRPPSRLVECWLNGPQSPEIEEVFRWYSAVPAFGLHGVNWLHAVRRHSGQFLTSQVIGETQDFIGLHTGHQWLQAIGVDMTGRHLNAFENARARHKCGALFSQVVQARRPLIFKSRIEAWGQPRKVAEMMFLPLFDARGKVTHVVSMLERQATATARPGPIVLKHDQKSERPR